MESAEENKSIKKKYMWKGRYVSEKMYNLRKKQSENGKKRARMCEETDNAINVVDGNRIVNFGVMLKHMNCQSCEDKLLLHDLEKNATIGLATILFIRCSTCLFLNAIPTSEKFVTPVCKRARYDINLRGVLGAVNAGMGATHLQKVLSAMDVPPLKENTFKDYEELIGTAAKKVVEDSCYAAAQSERELTIKDVVYLSSILPEDTPGDFLLPQSTLQDNQGLTANDEIHNLLQENQDPTANNKVHNLLQENQDPTANNKENQDPTANDEIHNLLQENQDPTANNKVHNLLQDNQDPTANNTAQPVRVFLSYDMGWSRRGTDSLTGCGAVIGLKTGKIIDFGIRSRLCRKCQLGHDKADHDCSQNFSGSAKAMEADLGVQLMTNSHIMRKYNLEIGAFIGDNDSATSAGLNAVCPYKVPKLADKNHTSKGVSTALYKVPNEKDPSRELNSTSILYLHDCFTYAMAQHKGNHKTMATAVKNIPYHAHNKHEGCGDWYYS